MTDTPPPYGVIDVDGYDIAWQAEERGTRNGKAWTVQASSFAASYASAAAVHGEPGETIDELLARLPETVREAMRSIGVRAAS